MSARALLTIRGRPAMAMAALLLLASLTAIDYLGPITHAALAAAVLAWQLWPIYGSGLTRAWLHALGACLANREWAEAAINA